MYNKPTRCNSGSIVFIDKYALHVSDALCVHRQEHYKLQQQPLVFVQCATDFEHLYRIYSIPTHDKHQLAAVTVYSAPDDGRKGRPKHVEHTCSC